MSSRKPAATRKVEIVEAALRLADELGPDRLTTEAIAGAVGLTQPAIFRHFPTKQDLWAAVGARIGALMGERWAGISATDGGPTDRIQALVQAQLRLIQSTPAIPAILFSRELHVENEELRRAFRALMGRFHRLIESLVAEACERGELCPDLDPEDVAFLVIGLLQGLAVRWSISGRSFDLCQEGLRLLELQMRGLTPEKAWRSS